ncbi:hypothetical protein [uncultured Algibacter sp.]|uniref:hypothetical protein n=1 Tax=uncultured Algibacter sp. TaxID=298659 RepID=UPI003217B062
MFKKRNTVKEDETVYEAEVIHDETFENKSDISKKIDEIKYLAKNICFSSKDKAIELADISLDKFDDFKENAQKNISEIEQDAKIAYSEFKETANKYAIKAEKEFEKAKKKTKHLSQEVDEKLEILSEVGIKKLTHTKKRIKRFLNKL